MQQKRQHVSARLKGRSSSARLPRVTEAELHRAIVTYLRIVRPRALWFHVPNGGRRDIGTATKLKRLGTLAGMPDLVFLWSGGAALVELKRPANEQLRQRSGRMSDAQMAVADLCATLNIPFLLATKVDDVDRFLRNLGLIGAVPGKVRS